MMCEINSKFITSLTERKTSRWKFAHAWETVQWYFRNIDRNYARTDCET